MSGDAQSACIEILKHGKTPWNSEFRTRDIVILPANHLGLLQHILYMRISYYASSRGHFQGGRRSNAGIGTTHGGYSCLSFSFSIPSTRRLSTALDLALRRRPYPFRR